jgi:hypothetical protein
MVMDQFPPVLPHGPLKEIFPDVFFVTGAMKTVLMNADWQFSRNMTVVRDGDALSLINSIRLDNTGLAQLDALGRVVNVLKIGSMHGRDDAFYRARYAAKLWALPGMVHEYGVLPDCELKPECEMPFSGCSVFAFNTTKLPECILRIDRAGGILIACDSLQNLIEPDEFFSNETRQMMADMGFFKPANVGPLWMRLMQPQDQDFARLRELSFRHVLCGHGVPVLDIAKEAYAATFQRVAAAKGGRDARPAG